MALSHIPYDPHSRSAINQWAWGFHTVWGGVGTRGIIIAVPGLLELYGYGGIPEPGIWGPTAPDAVELPPLDGPLSSQGSWLY